MNVQTRPRSSDPAIRQVGVAALAKECAAWGGDDEAGWAELLGRISLHGNGFEIASELDRYHHVSGIDLELVEILDGASHCVWDAERKAVREWVAANNIRPSLALGERITYRRWSGVINGFDEAQGLYYLKPDDEPEKYKQGGGICVAYEDATPAQSERAA